MKLKMIVVDFEIPPKAKRWALRLGIPAVVLTVAGVALAAPLHVWNTGDTLDATDLNGNFAALQAEVVPPGAVVFFNLAAFPTGWSAASSVQGRYIVGMTSTGSLGVTVGSALSDQEDRPTGQHTHPINDPGHQHGIFAGAGSNGWYFQSSTFGSTNTAAAATNGAKTNITMDNPLNSVAGTNAPYVQLLACTKD